MATGAVDEQRTRIANQGKQRKQGKLKFDRSSNEKHFTQKDQQDQDKTHSLQKNRHVVYTRVQNEKQNSNKDPVEESNGQQVLASVTNSSSLTNVNQMNLKSEARKVKRDAVGLDRESCAHKDTGLARPIQRSRCVAVGNLWTSKSKDSRWKSGTDHAPTTVTILFDRNLRGLDSGDLDNVNLCAYLSTISGLDLQGCHFRLGKNSRAKSGFVASVQCPNSVITHRLIEAINETSENTLTRATLVNKDDFFIANTLKIMLEKAEIQISAHCQKIVAVDFELSKLISIKKNKKGKTIQISLEEWERQKLLKVPLESKKEELLKQKEVFEVYLANAQEKLQALSGTLNIERSDVNKLRMDFGLELNRFENSLPIYARKNDVIQCVHMNQVSIILGETGSGKSTQLLQYLHVAEFHKKGVIVCTQPRKVAVTSLAQRVAQEMGCHVGHMVGFQVGSLKKRNQQTRLLYVTDYALLNECLKDQTFAQFSCIVIDEAHERSIYTDLLLGLIKRILPQRPDLRVIITSATIDPEVFVRYFRSDEIPQNEPVVLKVSGRMFPVDVFYEVTSNEDYVGAAWQKALEVHIGEPPGDILVFLTTPIETERACKLLKTRVDTTAVVLELHGRLQMADQQKVCSKYVYCMYSFLYSYNIFLVNDFHTLVFFAYYTVRFILSLGVKQCNVCTRISSIFKLLRYR